MKALDALERFDIDWPNYDEEDADELLQFIIGDYAPDDTANPLFDESQFEDEDLEQIA